MNVTKTPLTALMMIIVIGLSACTTTVNPPGPTTGQGPLVEETPAAFAAPVGLAPFASDNEFRTVFTTTSNSYYAGGFGMSRGEVMMDMAVAEQAVAPSAMPGDGGSKVDFSETNVQVAGIDEADSIKTDGQYLYTISGSQVFILEAYPGEDAHVIEDIEYDERNPAVLFLDDDRLVVIGSRYGGFYGVERSIVPYWPRSSTFVDVFDVSSPDNPELLETYQFDGSYEQARLKDGYVYMALQEYRYGVPELPVVVRGDTASELSATSIYRYPIRYQNPNLYVLHSFSVDDPDAVESVGIVTEGQNTFYMSHDNIYVGSTQRIDEWSLRQDAMIEAMMPLVDAADKDRIERIRSVDTDILSENEKISKVLSIVQRYADRLSDDDLDALEDEVKLIYEAKLAQYDYLEYTLLSRVEYDDGELAVVADGKVPGSLNNQFSLDELDAVLRVATTVNARWDWVGDERTESENHVYTLDGELDELDGVKGIAKGEHIYSARYMGDKLYLVTFRQVDPFFVIDLSNPRDIEVLGELKVPGFSRYLHPYSEDIILGLGQDATDEGRTTGLKISLFDVSDPQNPEEITTYALEGKYSSSTAEWDHHAFLFSKEKELLVIPVNQYDYDTRERFNGVLVFNVEADDIDLMGGIEHNEEDYGYWSSSIERSVYIEDELFTKSYRQVQVHSLVDLDHIKTVRLLLDEPRYRGPIMYDVVDEAPMPGMME